MRWIVDTSMAFRDPNREEDFERIINSLKKLNIKHQVVQYVPFMNIHDIRELVGECNESVMCYGSLNFINKIKRIEELIPGAYCNLRAFECRNYYPIYGDMLLNNDYVMITWKKLMDGYYDGLRFLRPNSGNKIFTGIVTTHDRIQSNLGLEMDRIQDNTLIIMTSTKHVIKEWRFFVKKGKVITGSLYNVEGQLKFDFCDEGCEPWKMALEASKMYEPDPVYVIDICQLADGTYKILELNSMSCAGLYWCESDKIVQEVTEEVYQRSC